MKEVDARWLYYEAATGAAKGGVALACTILRRRRADLLPAQSKKVDKCCKQVTPAGGAIISSPRRVVHKQMSCIDSRESAGSRGTEFSSGRTRLGLLHIGVGRWIDQSDPRSDNCERNDRHFRGAA
jgi:hypothetical protein